MRDLKIVLEDMLDLVDVFYETYGYTPVVEADNWEAGEYRLYTIAIMGEFGEFNNVYVDTKWEGER